MALRHDYPPDTDTLPRPVSDITVTDQSTVTDVDVEMGDSLSSSDDLEEGDVLITVTDVEGRVRNGDGDGQQERNFLRKKTAARYPEGIRYSAFVRQRRWWKNREKHLLFFIAIGTIIINLLAAVAVLVYATIYQRTP